MNLGDCLNLAFNPSCAEKIINNAKLYGRRAEKLILAGRSIQIVQACFYVSILTGNTYDSWQKVLPYLLSAIFAVRLGYLTLRLQSLSLKPHGPASHIIPNIFKQTFGHEFPRSIRN